MFSQIFAVAILAAASVSAAPASVGTVKCDKVHSGVLTLSNASNRFNADIVEGSNQFQGKDTLVANSKTFSQNFDFYECNSTYEKTPAHEFDEGQDLWNGHITISGSTSKCLSPQRYGADLGYIQVVPCSFSDDSSQANQFWTLLHNKNGRYELSYRPSPDSTYPANEYTYVPGTDSDPKVLVHQGSPTFSDYKFTLGGLN